MRFPKRVTAAGACVPRSSACWKPACPTPASHPLCDRASGQSRRWLRDALLVGSACAAPWARRPRGVHRAEHGRCDRTAAAQSHGVRTRRRARAGREGLVPADAGGAGREPVAPARDPGSARPVHAGARLHGGACRPRAPLRPSEQRLSTADRSPAGDRPHRRGGPARGQRPGLRGVAARRDEPPRTLHRSRAERAAAPDPRGSDGGAVRRFHLPADPGARRPALRRLRRGQRCDRPGAGGTPADAAGGRIESPGEEHPGHGSGDRGPDPARDARTDGVSGGLRIAADGAFRDARPR